VLSILAFSAGSVQEQLTIQRQHDKTNEIFICYKKGYKMNSRQLWKSKAIRSFMVPLGVLRVTLQGSNGYKDIRRK